MQISKHKVVSMDYTLTDDQGTVIDTSKGREPLAYIQGIGNIIPGLEAALEGRTEGESVTVRVEPEQGYGERDETLLRVVPRNLFDVEEIQAGMQFHAQSEQGTEVVTVIGVTDEEVTVDSNHPLAGVALNFDVTIVEVRDASEEELSHGHVHGPGGHDH
jgi:FKBP-type peptidyl-prolyl cis-trans isomerase SlyD